MQNFTIGGNLEERRSLGSCNGALTNPAQQTLSWEVNSSSDGQEIRHIL